MSVRVASDDGPVVVETRAGGKPWTVVCEGVCAAPLPLDAEYRVHADGVSAPFHLIAKDEVMLDVHTRRTGKFVGGVVLVSFGGVVLAASTASAVLGVAVMSAGSIFGFPFLFAAAAGALIGTATLVPGIFLMTHGSSTRVEQAAIPIFSARF